jgi:hypothetical protein
VANYSRADFSSEADLEASIVEVQDLLFGTGRIYLDVKKKIGLKGVQQNIPDGYLLDLNGPKPKLFVVENELAAHDPLRHIAVQILQFSLSFESEPIAVKKILMTALNSQPDLKKKCEGYASANEYRNLDHMLEWLVFDSPFSALVIIDEVPDNLEKILASKFQFGVEVLELQRYRNSAGECFYLFEPFLADLVAQDEAATGDGGKPAQLILAEVDSIVVPAHEDGFQEVFLGENRWYAVRIHGSMRPQIKYIAVYRTAPVSAITHIAPVKSIEPWKDTGKYVLNFSQPAKEIGPIPMAKPGRVGTFQGIRYTNHDALESAKSLDDLW